MENKGVGFAAQQAMDAVLDYAKVPVTIQYYVNSQSFVMRAGIPSVPKDNIHACCCDAMADTL